MVFAVVALVGLLLGMLIAGRPQTIGNDLASSQIEVGARSTSTTPAVVATTATRSSSSATTAPATGLVPESTVRVVVADASGSERSVARAVDRLRALGYTDLVSDDALDGRVETVILYARGRVLEAERLASQLAIAPSRVQPRPAEALTVNQVVSDLWLLVGSDRS